MPATPPPDLAAIAAEAAREAGNLDAGLLGDHLAVVVELAAGDRRLARPELERYRARGRRAAQQGVPLRALIELYLTATWRLWPQLPVVADARAAQPVTRAAGSVLRALDDGVAALSEGYQLARRSLARQQEAQRRELFDDLLSGLADATALVARAAAVGVDLAAPHAVAVVVAERPFADATPLAAQLERAILGRRADADALLASKEGRLVVVFAAPDRAAIRHVCDQLALTLASGSASRRAGTRAAAATGQGARGAGWRLAIGRAFAGPAGVSASYREALESFELAERLALPGAVVDAADLLVYTVILRDRAAIADLVRSTLLPLEQARGGAAPMLETLAAYFASGASVTATARRLHLSVRATSYRLSRIAGLLGRDPTDPAQHLGLHVATVGARLLGWPEHSLATESASLPEPGNTKAPSRPI